MSAETSPILASAVLASFGLLLALAARVSPDRKHDLVEATQIIGFALIAVAIGILIWYLIA